MSVDKDITSKDNVSYDVNDPANSGVLRKNANKKKRVTLTVDEDSPYRFKDEKLKNIFINTPKARVSVPAKSDVEYAEFTPEMNLFVAEAATIIGTGDLNFDFVITSGTEGKHAKNSKHYDGRAVDVRISKDFRGNEEGVNTPWDDPMYLFFYEGEGKKLLAKHNMYLNDNLKHGGAPHLHIEESGKKKNTGAKTQGDFTTGTVANPNQETDLIGSTDTSNNIIQGGGVVTNALTDLSNEEAKQKALDKVSKENEALKVLQEKQKQRQQVIASYEDYAKNAIVNPKKQQPTPPSSTAYRPNPLIKTPFRSLEQAVGLPEFEDGGETDPPYQAKDAEDYAFRMKMLSDSSDLHIAGEKQFQELKNFMGDINDWEERENHFNKGQKNGWAMSEEEQREFFENELARQEESKGRGENPLERSQVEAGSRRNLGKLTYNKWKGEVEQEEDWRTIPDIKRGEHSLIDPLMHFGNDVGGNQRILFDLSNKEKERHPTYNPDLTKKVERTLPRGKKDIEYSTKDLSLLHVGRYKKPTQKVLPPPGLKDPENWEKYLPNNGTVVAKEKPRSESSLERERLRDVLKDEMKESGFTGYTTREVLKEGSEAQKAYQKHLNKTGSTDIAKEELLRSLKEKGIEKAITENNIYGSSKRGRELLMKGLGNYNSLAEDDNNVYFSGKSDPEFFKDFEKNEYGMYVVPKPTKGANSSIAKKGLSNGEKPKTTTAVQDWQAKGYRKVHNPSRDGDPFDYYFKDPKTGIEHRIGNEAFVNATNDPEAILQERIKFEDGGEVHPEKKLTTSADASFPTPKAGYVQMNNKFVSNQPVTYQEPIKPIEKYLTKNGKVYGKNPDWVEPSFIGEKIDRNTITNPATISNTDMAKKAITPQLVFPDQSLLPPEAIASDNSKGTGTRYVRAVFEDGGTISPPKKDLSQLFPMIRPMRNFL